MKVITKINTTIEDVLPKNVGLEINPDKTTLDELTPGEMVLDDSVPEELEATLEELDPTLGLELGFRTT